MGPESDHLALGTQKGRVASDICEGAGCSCVHMHRFGGIYLESVAASSLGSVAAGSASWAVLGGRRCVVVGVVQRGALVQNVSSCVSAWAQGSHRLAATHLGHSIATTREGQRRRKMVPRAKEGAEERKSLERRKGHIYFPSRAFRRFEGGEELSDVPWRFFCPNPQTLQERV